MYTAAYITYSAMTVAATWIFFGQWHFDGIFLFILSQYLFGLLILSATLSASAVAKSAGPGAFAGFGLLILLPLTDFFGKAAQYLPGSLMSIPGQIINGVKTGSDILWPSVTALLFAAVIIVASTLHFRKREL